MPKLNLTKAVPGLASTLVNVAAPIASIVALWNHTDAQVKGVIQFDINRAVMDMYMQFATVFSALLITLVASFVYMSARSTSSRLRVVAIIGFGLSLMLFIWMFTLGGNNTVPVDAYVRDFDPGATFYLPPWESPLTKLRVVLLAYSIILTYFELTAKDDDNGAVAPVPLATS